jgi:hypothetical protein
LVPKNILKHQLLAFFVVISHEYIPFSPHYQTLLNFSVFIGHYWSFSLAKWLITTWHFGVQKPECEVAVKPAYGQIFPGTRCRHDARSIPSQRREFAEIDL